MDEMTQVFVRRIVEKYHNMFASRDASDGVTTCQTLERQGILARLPSIPVNAIPGTSYYSVTALGAEQAFGAAFPDELMGLFPPMCLGAPHILLGRHALGLDNVNKVPVAYRNYYVCGDCEDDQVRWESLVLLGMAKQIEVSFSRRTYQLTRSGAELVRKPGERIEHLFPAEPQPKEERPMSSENKIKVFKISKTDHSEPPLFVSAACDLDASRFALAYGIRQILIEEFPVQVLTDEILEEILRSGALAALSAEQHFRRRTPRTMYRVRDRDRRTVAYSFGASSIEAAEHARADLGLPRDFELWASDAVELKDLLPRKEGE